MITKALSDFTSPIVDKALETGARGKTSVTTNYGVIGDAFFKKANLELGIAELQANMGMEAARLKSGLEMDKARLMLQANEMKINTDLQAFQLEQEAAADESSPMDVILGAVGGAAQGAAAGAAFGPKGALIGGIAGGALTGLSYAQGGKRTGDKALQTVGMVANATSVIKGFSDQRKSKDTWTSLMGTARDIMGMMQNSDPSVAQAGREQWAMFQTEAHKVMSPYMNPEQIDSALAGLNDFASKSAPSQQTQAEIDRGRMFQKVVEFESDPRWTSGSPAEQEEALNEFFDEMDIEYAIQNGGDIMPPELKIAWAEKLGKTVGVKGLGEMAYNQYVDDEPIDATTTTKQSIPTPKKTASKKGGSIQSAAPTPSLDVGQKEQKALPQPTQPRPTPEQRTSGIPFRLPQGNGIEMDDGMDIFSKPVQAEQELHKIGEKSAEVMREKEEMESIQPEQKPLSTREKIKHNNSLSPDEFDERKIPIWERGVSRDDPRLKKPAERRPKDDDKLQVAEPIDEVEETVERVDKISSEPSLDQRYQKVSQETEAALKKSPNPEAAAVIANIDKQIAMVEKGKVTEFEIGLGAELGYNISKSGVGGKKLSDYVPLGKVGKNKDWVGGKRGRKETSAWREIDQLSAVNTTRLARVSGEKGALTEPDKEQFNILEPAPTKSRTEVIRDLIAQKELVLGYVKSGVSDSGGSKKASAPRPGSAAWRAEQEAKWEWEEEKKQRKEENNFKLIRPGRRYGR